MIKYPEIDPVALSIPLPEFLHSFFGAALNIHWYGLAYVVSAYLIYLRMVATKDNHKIKASKEEVSDVVFTYGLFFGIIIGGRLGSVLFYDLHLQFDDPLLFLKNMARGYVLSWCFDWRNDSYVYVFAKKKNYEFLKITDWVSPQLPIALFLGRIANFINAELYGRETDVSWGMIFPTDPDGLVRHPSQLYEAFLEGLLLFIFLNFIIKSTDKVGRHSAYFLIGYGVTSKIYS